MTEKAQIITTAASYATSAGTTAIGVWTVNEWAAIGGLFLAAATFIVNLVYRHLHHKMLKQGMKK